MKDKIEDRFVSVKTSNILYKVSNAFMLHDKKVLGTDCVYFGINNQSNYSL